MKELKELLPASTQSQAPAQQESKHLKTGEERQFELAIKEQKIASLPIIPDSDKTSPNPLKEALRYVMLLVGIRAVNMPNDEEKAVLFYYIRKHYGGHTVSEIRLAFEMAIAGQLPIAEKEVKAYENFSVLYFASIMNAYRKWAGEQYKLVEHREMKEVKAPSVQYDWREMIETEYQTFTKPQSVLYKLWPSEFYDTLVSDGFMPSDAFSAHLSEAKTNLCADIQKQIVAAQGLSNGEKYNGVSDLEKRLHEIREGRREAEVNLLAKQMSVLAFFDRAELDNRKNLYVNETE